MRRGQCKLYRRQRGQGMDNIAYAAEFYDNDTHHRDVKCSNPNFLKVTALM